MQIIKDKKSEICLFINYDLTIHPINLTLKQLKRIIIHIFNMQNCSANNIE